MNGNEFRQITLPHLASIMLGLTGELGFGLCNSISPATKKAAGGSVMLTWYHFPKSETKIRWIISILIHFLTPMTKQSIVKKSKPDATVML